MASAEQLAADLTSHDVAVRRQAATQLATEPQAAAAMALALATVDEDEAVREAASSALEDLGPPAISTAP
ncbi:MAG TPA: hypothetical protein VL096_03415, partial [Pirellulaceae bacterium]|nr:hypothetical protein [Pirellulaceae bacterium]